MCVLLFQVFGNVRWSPAKLPNGLSAAIAATSASASPHPMCARVRPSFR
jgi:hypothetical protein